MNAKQLIWANSELDRGMIQEEPITPVEFKSPDERDEIEKVELAYIDDETVQKFENQFQSEIEYLHTDLWDEYLLLRESCKADYTIALKEKKRVEEE